MYTLGLYTAFGALCAAAVIGVLGSSLGLKRGSALLAVLALSVSLILSGCTLFGGGVKHQGDLDLSTIPEWSGATCVDINDGEPTFTDEEMTTSCYESYEDLDDLGRCGTCETCAGPDLMPEGPREQISHIHPSGWHSDKYELVKKDV